MRTAINFEARDYPLKDVLFSSIRFVVPRYQRPYAWLEDQIGEFWNDITSDESSVFLGSFILNNEPLSENGYVEVIDGQQRIVTITIFMAVLRDLAKSFDSDLADLVQEFDIGYKDRDGKLHWRIKCGESTQPFFQKYIQEQIHKMSSSRPETKEEHRIKSAYEMLKNRVVKDLEHYTNDSEKIVRLRKLRDKVSNLVVIRIDIDSEEDAYEIFETTNARGIDLSVADLVKNLIFKNVQIDDDRGDFAKQIWGEIVGNVEDTDTEMKRFIRYFWISKNPLVYDKALFKTIKRKTTAWDRLLENLWTSSEHYNQLLAGGKDAWLDQVKHGVDIFRSVSALRFMGVMQCHVLFLSLMRNFDKLQTDPRPIFELIEKFSFNYSAICKLPANRVEKLYSDYANEIERIVTKDPVKRVGGNVQRTFANLKKVLTDIRPSYEVFKEKFLEISYTNSQRSRQLIKYILEKIERSLGGTGEKITDFDIVTIEHILPRNPSKKWGLSKKEIKSYVNKLGNLTLVHKDFNAAAGNKDLKTKIESLKKTDMFITKQLVSQFKESDYKWGEDDIVKRQENLADFAYHKVWKF